MLLLIHQNDWLNLLLLDMSLNGIKPIKEEKWVSITWCAIHWESQML